MYYKVDQLKINHLCPHCNKSVLGDDHKINRLAVNEYYNYIISCPEHPHGSFMIGVFKEDAKPS